MTDLTQTSAPPNGITEPRRQTVMDASVGLIPTEPLAELESTAEVKYIVSLEIHSHNFTKLGSTTIDAEIDVPTAEEVCIPGPEPTLFDDSLQPIPEETVIQDASLAIAPAETVESESPRAPPKDILALDVSHQTSTIHSQSGDVLADADSGEAPATTSEFVLGTSSGVSPSASDTGGYPIIPDPKSIATDDVSVTPAAEQECVNQPEQVRSSS